MQHQYELDIIICITAILETIEPVGQKHNVGFLFIGEACTNKTIPKLASLFFILHSMFIFCGLALLSLNNSNVAQIYWA
jgi:hypothetical protein